MHPHSGWFIVSHALRAQQGYVPIKNRKPSGNISLTKKNYQKERLPMKTIITEEMRFRQKVVEYGSCQVFMDFLLQLTPENI